MTKNADFGPNLAVFGPKIQILGSKKHIFAPSGQLEPQWSMFKNQKWPKLVQNLHFWSFWAKYCHFFTFCPIPDQNTIWTRCLGGFSIMWVTKLLISLVKIRIFAQERPNLAQSWHFCSFWASLASSFGVLWWVGWWLWCAGAVTHLNPFQPHDLRHHHTPPEHLFILQHFKEEDLHLLPCFFFRQISWKRQWRSSSCGEPYSL